MYSGNARTAAKSLQTSAGFKRRPKVSLLKRLVIEAVSSEPLKGMVLRDIYSYVQKHCSEYTNGDVVWHKNVRFLLSSNKYFVKSNERNPNGNGFYWKFDSKIYQQCQNIADARRSKTRISVNTQNELSEAKSKDQRQSSVSRSPPNRPMNSQPTLIEQKDFKVCQKSQNSVSYPLVNVGENIQFSSYPSAESGYPWPDGSLNAYNQIPISTQDSLPGYESPTLEQYYKYPNSLAAGNNTSYYDQRFALSSVFHPESAIFQRREPQLPFVPPCSAACKHLPQQQYTPLHLQRTYRDNYDNQVSDTAPCPFYEYDDFASSTSHPTRADCAFQFRPSLSAQSMHVYISPGHLNSSGRMVARDYNEGSFPDQSTHQAWPYSGNQYNEIPQFGDSFGINGGY